MPVIGPAFDVHFRPKNGKARPSLGVLVCEKIGSLPPFGETGFIRRMTEKGRRLGLFVFAFDPGTWNDVDDTVEGWAPDAVSGEWRRNTMPFPPLLFDRAWPSDRSEAIAFSAAIGRIGERRPLSWLSQALPGKSDVHRALAREKSLNGLLPPTLPYENARTLDEALERYGESLFLKPSEGSKGCSVVAVSRETGGKWTLCGRTKDNRAFKAIVVDKDEALRRIDRWIGVRRYLVQPRLDLRSAADEPYDLRALVQKDERGRWTLTGIAARCGSTSSVTSNLHGGGRAAPPNDILIPLFGVEGAETILAELRSCCGIAARAIERHFGRFAELGLDFGVDRAGKLWLLEANGKPGRAAMACLGRNAALAAASKPVLYARHILFGPSGRVRHEFDHL